MLRESCASSELAVHCSIRKHFGADRITLSQLRSHRALLNAWLRSTPLPTADGCLASPPDRTPLRVEVHGEDIEFGYELVQVVPYAYAACLHGVLQLRSYCTGMQPFYYFALSDHIVRKKCNRHAFHSNSTYNMLAQHARPVGRFWDRQPPYRDRYFDPGLRRSHPRGIALVLTKQGAPNLPVWAPSGTSNTWSETGLQRLLRALSERADRVYYDHSDGAESRHALQMVEDGKVMLVRKVASGISARGDSADALNQAKLQLAATADVVVATQGGAAVLGSLVAKQLLILCRRGRECFGRPPDVVWWRLFNNATIETHTDESVLTQRAVALLPVK